MKSQMHVFGGFKTHRGAHEAVDRLADVGVPRDSISVLMTDDARRRLGTVERRTKGLEGAAGGGISGGLLGAIVATVASVSAGVIPGVGLVAAGPIVAALAGGGAGAAAGGTIGAVVGLGMSEREVELYTEILKGDGILVTVSTGERKVRDLAARTLEEMGAVQLETRRGTTAHL